jgi:iron only hydrogenase large subunit-like protein
MACQSGCVAGGGQPIRVPENSVRTRIKAIYEIDNRESINAAHKNPQMNKVYSEFLDKPMGLKSLELLHTNYTTKEIL